MTYGQETERVYSYNAVARTGLALSQTMSVYMAVGPELPVAPAVTCRVGGGDQYPTELFNACNLAV